MQRDRAGGAVFGRAFAKEDMSRDRAEVGIAPHERLGFAEPASGVCEKRIRVATVGRDGEEQAGEFFGGERTGCADLFPSCLHLWHFGEGIAGDAVEAQEPIQEHVKRGLIFADGLGGALELTTPFDEFVSAHVGETFPAGADENGGDAVFRRVDMLFAPLAGAEVGEVFGNERAERERGGFAFGGRRDQAGFDALRLHDLGAEAGNGDLLVGSVEGDGVDAPAAFERVAAIPHAGTRAFAQGAKNVFSHRLQRGGGHGSAETAGGVVGGGDVLHRVLQFGEAVRPICGSGEAEFSVHGAGIAIHAHAPARCENASVRIHRCAK